MTHHHRFSKTARAGNQDEIWTVLQGFRCGIVDGFGLVGIFFDIDLLWYIVAYIKCVKLSWGIVIEERFYFTVLIIGIFKIGADIVIRSKDSSREQNPRGISCELRSNTVRHKNCVHAVRDFIWIVQIVVFIMLPRGFAHRNYIDRKTLAPVLSNIWIKLALCSLYSRFIMPWLNSISSNGIICSIQ